jgi:hypothetical protein
VGEGGVGDWPPNLFGQQVFYIRTRWLMLSGESKDLGIPQHGAEKISHLPSRAEDCLGGCANLDHSAASANRIDWRHMLLSPIPIP